VVAPGSAGFDFCAAWLGLDPLDPVTNTVLSSFSQSDSQVESNLFGNPDLSVEESDTITIGAVFSRETAFGDIRATLDYYDIEVNDPITTRSVNATMALCTATLDPNSAACAGTGNLVPLGAFALMPRLSSGQLSGIAQARINNPSGALATNGVDLAVGYGIDAFGGRLDINALVNYLDSYSVGGTEYAGITFGLGLSFPEWKASTRTTYSYNDWQFSWQWTHIGEVNDYGYSTGPYAAYFPFIEAINYHDFSVRWFATDNLEFTAVCQNCLDQEPQLGPLGATASGAFSGPNVDTSVYDGIGRYFRFGVRARF
jgi:outer membrane receptor for ferrienterochelin and colicin